MKDRQSDSPSRPPQRDSATVLPFHFVPAVEQRDRPGDLPYPEVRAGKHEGILHHRFVPGRFSGRILCRLTTETPTVLGAERCEQKNGPAVVEPFLLDGQPAIPASSLRGMISALAEAASNSALRILDDRVYSFRKSADRALRNFGEIVVEEIDGEKKYFVRPLRNKVRVAKVDVHDNPLETCRDGERRYYGLHRSAPKKGARLTPWEDIPAEERGKYERGIVRVMTQDGRDLPDARRFETFVPYDPREVSRRRTIPVTSQAVERFHELADERTEAVKHREGPALPYEPVGSKRQEEADGEQDARFRLKNGDFVYYWSRGGDATEEIALSAIWRERVEDRQGKPHRAWSFFQDIDPDLVPFHAGRMDTQLTIAEQLFGFVSDDDAADANEAVPALASRVRFAFGRLEASQSDPFLEPCTLRILDSPKPPSPSVYFSDFADPESYIAKHELRPGKQRPQGRKLYVHRSWDPDSDPENAPWRTKREDERTEMKSQVRPLRHGLSFLFHLDADNLSDEELGLLLYALRPTPRFRHKLGMGKPLGLGTVRVDVLGLFEVDRQERYAPEGLFAPRYAHAAVEAAAGLSALGERYRAEREAAENAGHGPDRIDKLRDAWQAQMDEKIHNALARLGQERFEPAEVTVPLVEGATDPEDETFKWFVAYDRTKARRTLQPIGPEGTPWPRLARLKEK